MPLYLDTSALVRRYVNGPDRDIVVEAMASTTEWCTSVLTGCEARQALRLLSAHPAQHERLLAAFWRDWASLWTIPLDARCLARAAELGSAGTLRTVDALHLAAADRLPRPLAYCTFDPRQVSVAVALGFDVVLAPKPSSS